MYIYICIYIHIKICISIIGSFSIALLNNQRINGFGYEIIGNMMRVPWIWGYTLFRQTYKITMKLQSPATNGGLIQLVQSNYAAWLLTIKLLLVI